MLTDRNGTGAKNRKPKTVRNVELNGRRVKRKNTKNTLINVPHMLLLQFNITKNRILVSAARLSFHRVGATTDDGRMTLGRAAHVDGCYRNIRIHRSTFTRSCNKYLNFNVFIFMCFLFILPQAWACWSDQRPAV